MKSGEDAPHRKEILSSLDAIVDISERWLRQLRKRQRHVRLASAFLTMLLVSFGIMAVTIGYILTQYPSEYFFQYHRIFYTIVGLAPVAGVLSGVASYYLLRRRHEHQLEKLSASVEEMKKNRDQQGLSGDALSLAEKTMTLFHEVVRKRNQDSLLFGVVAFVITVIPAKLPAAIVVGVAVWLYFRYEMNRNYEKEISKLEEQRRLFEQRKKEFIDSL